MKSLGIDLGTTTLSAVIVDTVSGQVLESRTIPNDSVIPTQNEWEHLQDAGRITRKACALMEEMISRFPDTDSIGITGQMHGIVYLNAEGAIISPLYTWQDGRGNLPYDCGRSGKGFNAAVSPHTDGKGNPAPSSAGSPLADPEEDTKATRRNAGECTLTEEILSRTGLHTYTGYGLVTHLWLDRKGLVPEGAASLCTIGDALGVQLTGRKKPLLHAGNAAGLGFYDAGCHRFHTDALAGMGMRLDLLPETTADFASLGKWRSIPVSVAIGDNQAAFLGAVGLKENVIALNMGTGGQVSILSDICCEIPGVEVRPLTSDRWLLVGASLCGGASYALLEQFFRRCLMSFGADAAETDIYSVMEHLACMGDSSGLKVQTTFLGTREDPGLRGTITGIGTDNFTPEALIRGVLEGMARELYDLYTIMQRATGVHAGRIIASGNGLRRNSVLRGICADLFGMPVELSPCTEEAACGAARYSGHSKIS